MPVAGKLITSGLRSGFLEDGTSPTTPFEFKVLSPTGIINCEMGGIGLGIVAALDISNQNIPAKKANFRCRNPMETEPIPVNHINDVEMGNDAGSLEEEYYTIVTHHKPNRWCTKPHSVSRKPIEIRDRTSIFDISPYGDDDTKMYIASEFLNSCHLCNKRLHGRDIYMYRGDKAFCSPECRSKQIGMDERRDKHHSSQASSSPSNGTGTHVLATGIFAM